DRVLTRIKKGVTADQLIQAVRKIEDGGIKASVTFISGLAGKEDWQEHAVETGRMMSRMEPSYVGLLTLMIERETELYRDIQSGDFKLLSPYEVLLETELMLQNIQVEKTCVFRSNHASNYLSLRGDLPGDKDSMLYQIKLAKENASMLKEERFRML
ncbi:MAG: radical SAM protein, partial [Eubacteriales bacterium]|nr:radical SAM protein [Eubacteriales bacterium]